MGNSGFSFQQSEGSTRPSSLFLYYFLAPILCAFSGFHTASYLMVGIFSWPRTSRVIVFTIGMLIFAYEFIFKNTFPPASNEGRSAREWVLYTCVIPYAIGAGTLIVLAGQ